MPGRPAFLPGIAMCSGRSRYTRNAIIMPGNSFMFHYRSLRLRMVWDCRELETFWKLLVNLAACAPEVETFCKLLGNLPRLCMRRCALILSVVAGVIAQFSCAPTPKAVDFASAKAAYGKGDYRTALSGLMPAAKQGNPEAEVLLARMYEDGRGVQQNYSEAFHWYKQAAERENGDPVAEYSVGKLYAEGHGIPTDAAEAVKWLRIASDHGNGDASWYLGDMYYRGTGVPIDRYEAVRLAALSARPLR